MKPSDASPAVAAPAASSTARRLPREAREFLPAALEIIETPASPVGRAIGGAIVAFACLALAWAALGEIDIVATAQGRVIASGKAKTVQPFETGVVRAIHVADGASVKAGDALVELDPTSDEADETRLVYDLRQDRLDVARLEALLSGDLSSFAPPPDAPAPMQAAERRQMESQAAEQAAKLAIVERQIAQKEAEAHEIAVAIDKAQTVLPLQREQRDMRQALLRNQYGSKLTYLQAEQQVVETEHELAAQRERGVEIEHALGALDRQKAQAEAEYRKGLLADLARAQTQASEHNEERVKAAQKRALRTLTAPVDGTVQQLAVHTLGGVATAAQPLMVIVPKGAALEIEAVLANKDAGFVHKGQEVEIKVEAFSFTRYGLLHGAVLSVSQDVVAPQDVADDGRGGRANAATPKDEEERQARQPSYVARIALKETGLETEDGFSPLEPGMAVAAEIKTGKRTVLSYLLSPLARYKHEGLRER